MPDATEERPPVLGPSVKPSIDELDGTFIDYRDHSHLSEARVAGVPRVANRWGILYQFGAGGEPEGF
jgi:hypothetical protein